MQHLPDLDNCLRIYPVAGVLDFMMVRKIRNSCRTYMTRDNSKIGILRQGWFYLKYYASDKMTVLYIAKDKKNQPVGYGLIHYDSNLKPWISGGLLPAFRGKGYGKELFKFLSDSWHFPVWLEVRQDNPRALSLYTKLGFQEVSRTEGQDAILVMKKDAKN